MEDYYSTNNITKLEQVQVDDAVRRQPRRIHKVPQHLRGKNRHLYDPVVLSLGPYHHGKRQYRKMEEIKEEVLNKFVSDNIAKDPTKDGEFFHKEILDRIKEIRDNYEHEEVDKYSDEALAKIILRDACFVVAYLENPFEMNGKITTCLGMSTIQFISQDYFLLENQIPLWIIKHLIDLSFGENKADELVCQHLSYLSFGDHRVEELPWEDNKELPPLHLLEAIRAVNLEGEATNEATTERKHRILTKKFKGKKFQKTIDINNGNAFNRYNLPFRSVAYLQAKGIHFGPSTPRVTDIIFTSYSYYGTLQLPITFVSSNSSVYLSNLIAFEMSPGNLTQDLVVTSYINFMKSLLDNPNDVQQLRENDILFSDLANDEEVVKVYKQINTFGFHDYGSFADVKRQIDKHCSSKTKTWIAEFIHNYCHSPWSIIALFAATFLLCLTFLQTYYTIRPHN